MITSINVLFDVLLKVNILMSPHVPFLTEHMYQNMKICVAEKSKFKEDSIHHLRIPEANHLLKDEKITEEMQNMMSIIETARKLRENKNISLKQPIMSLTIVNKSKQLFEELKPFLNYIDEEVNVADILHEADIDKYVKLTSLPNLPSLGPKFKGNKDFGNIRTAITNLNTAQLKKAQEEGFVQIEGHKIDLEDVLISEKFINDNLKEYEVIGGEKVM